MPKNIRVGGKKVSHGSTARTLQPDPNSLQECKHGEQKGLSPSYIRSGMVAQAPGDGGGAGLPQQAEGP